MLSRLSDDAVWHCLEATFALSTITLVAGLVATGLLLAGVEGALVYAQALVAAFPCVGLTCAMLVGEAKRRKGEG